MEQTIANGIILAALEVMAAIAVLYILGKIVGGVFHAAGEALVNGYDSITSHPRQWVMGSGVALAVIGMLVIASHF